MRVATRQLKRRLVDLYWMLRGPRIRVPAMPVNPCSVLFVCKGNICRSPFAEHLASKLQLEGGKAEIRFGSAGLHVPKPTPSPEYAIRVASQFGVDLEKHRSQSISLDLMESNEMIFAMEVWQYEHLQALFPQYRKKLFLLPLLDVNGGRTWWGYQAFNIQDPYGGPARDFELCFDRIGRCLKSFQVAVKGESAEHLRNSELERASVSAKAN